MKKLLLTFSMLLIIGCSSTGIIPLDRDSYMIGKKDGMPGLGVSLSNKAEVYKEANEFCSGKNLEVETLRVVTEPAKPAQLGYTELHFRCIQKGAKAKPLVREPDAIIEFRNK